MKLPTYQRAPRALVTRAEAADMLGCSLRSVSRYQNAGRLRFERRGQRTLILKEDVVAMTRPGYSIRLENQRIRRMMAKVAMLELKLADVMEAMDVQLDAKKPEPYEQPDEF